MIDYSKFEYLGRSIDSELTPYPILAKDADTILYIAFETLEMLNLKSRETSTVFKSDVLRGCDFARLTPNQKYLLIGKSIIYALDSQTGEVVHQYKSHDMTRTLRGFVVTTDGRSLIAAESSTNNCVCWDIETGKQIQHFTAERLAVGNDPKLLAHARRKVLKLHEFGKGNRWIVELSEIMNVIAMNPQSTLIAVAYRGRSIRQKTKIFHAVIQIRNCIDGAVLAELHEPEPPQGVGCSIKALEFSPDGQALVSSDTSGHVTIWDLGEQKIIHRVNAFDGGLVSFTFSPDGRWFAVSHTSNRSIKIWGLPGLFEIGQKS